MARDLRRQLKLAAHREGERRPVQVAAHPMEAAEYAKWRRRALRRGALASAPALEGGRYALVLFALAPAAADRFVRHGSASQLVAPTVGAFLPTVEPTAALAGTLAGWLEIHTEPWRSRRHCCTPTGAGGSPTSDSTGRYRRTPPPRADAAVHGRTPLAWPPCCSSHKGRATGSWPFQ